MSYTIVRSQKEIDELLNQCAEAEADGKSAFPGMSFEEMSFEEMSFEEGITYAIKWLTDKSAPHPLDD